jgi:hypothetical protein
MAAERPAAEHACRGKVISGKPGKENPDSSARRVSLMTNLCNGGLGQDLLPMEHRWLESPASRFRLHPLTGLFILLA